MTMLDQVEQADSEGGGKGGIAKKARDDVDGQPIAL